MDYTRWSREYFENAQKVKEDIEKVKTKLKHSKGDEKRALRTTLITLRTMYYECMHTSEVLLMRGGKGDAA